MKEGLKRPEEGGNRQKMSKSASSGLNWLKRGGIGKWWKKRSRDSNRPERAKMARQGLNWAEKGRKGLQWNE